MSRGHRCCRPREARSACPHGAKRGECDITLWDHVRLMHDLVHDPKGVLVFFPLAGIGCLAELTCWEGLKVTCPDDVARIVATAALFGIPEKPQKPEKP